MDDHYSLERGVIWMSQNGSTRMDRVIDEMIVLYIMLWEHFATKC